MIKELRISNFRLFDNEVTVRFRPITIFIGRNNAGKSSVIKFLMMLKQTLNVGSSFLVTNAHEVSLGGFSQLKNKTSRKRQISFSLTVGENGSPDDAFRQLLHEEKISYSEGRTYTVRGAINYNQKNQFIGKEQAIIFSTGNKKLMEKVSAVTPNSRFLQLDGKNVKGRLSEAYAQIIEDVLVENLKYDIVGLQHLAAPRKDIEGDIRTNTPATRSVGKIGEDTIAALWHEEILNDERKKDFLLKHTSEVLAIDEIGFEELHNLAACNVRNAQTKAKVNIGDFGFGVSQCMPIFVQGILMPPYTQLIVEQPEAQVHPTAQIEMGNFFVDLWNKYQVGSIIETHSDNLILRMRHHIKKGELLPDDVSVVYFTCEDGMPVIKNLSIQCNGTIKGLPMEFFGGNLREVLKMGAL